MLRNARTVAIGLVIFVVCIPSFTDTVSATIVPGTYTYEYTWTFTTTGSGTTTSFWIVVNEGVQSGDLVDLGTNPDPPWSYQDLQEDYGPAAGADAVLWTGFTAGGASHTFSLGSNVCPPDTTGWESNNSAPVTTTGFTQSPAPEAGTLLLFAAGLTSLTGWGFRRRRRK